MPFFAIFLKWVSGQAWCTHAIYIFQYNDFDVGRLFSVWLGGDAFYSYAFVIGRHMHYHYPFFLLFDIIILFSTFRSYLYVRTWWVDAV
jgi:hypothetical protein